MRDLVRRLYDEVKFELNQYAMMDDDGAPVQDTSGQIDGHARDALRELLEVLKKHIVL